jgi:PQQ-dependent dehydrogenase (methanol/ethanol family)
VNRGVAVWKGRVYVGTIDGRLIALDAPDGKPAGRCRPPTRPSPTRSPARRRVIKDKVLIGNGGAEYGVRGYITAYDTASGKQVWRFYTTPNPNGQPDGAASDKVMAEKAGSTWSDGEWKETGGGGTAWDAISYDPTLDLVYIGVATAVPGTTCAVRAARATNLFLSSILALKPDTGEYVWHYQTTPGESWDYTATQQIMLADLNIGGQPRKVLMQAPKNGFFYVIDRANGKLISAKPYDRHHLGDAASTSQTGRPIETPARAIETGASQVPGPLGAHNWQPMAFNPKTGLGLHPTNVTPFAYTDEQGVQVPARRLERGRRLPDNAHAQRRGTLKASMALIRASSWPGTRCSRRRSGPSTTLLLERRRAVDGGRPRLPGRGRG